MERFWRGSGIRNANFLPVPGRVDPLTVNGLLLVLFLGGVGPSYEPTRAVGQEKPSR